MYVCIPMRDRRKQGQYIGGERAMYVRAHVAKQNVCKYEWVERGGGISGEQQQIKKQRVKESARRGGGGFLYE